MKRIFVPDLSKENALEFCKELETMDLSGECYFDFCNVKWCTPFAMLIVSRTLKKLRMMHSDCLWYGRNYNQTRAHSYAQYVGFFTAAGISVGNTPGEVRGSDAYLPITKVTMSDLRSESPYPSMPVGEIVENKAREMAAVLSQGNTSLKNTSVFLLREMMRNIPEHSKSEDIWYCAQYWPSKKIVELAILDEGVGIKYSLIENAAYTDKISNDEDALRLAIQPGVSEAFSPRARHVNDRDVWANSGFGLYMISQICARLSGTFLIASGNSALSAQCVDDEIEYKTQDTMFAGTAIHMSINTSRIHEYDRVKSQILKQGELLAKQARSAFMSASKSSHG